LGSGLPPPNEASDIARLVSARDCHLAAPGSIPGRASFFDALVREKVFMKATGIFSKTTGSFHEKTGSFQENYEKFSLQLTTFFFSESQQFAHPGILSCFSYVRMRKSKKI